MKIALICPSNILYMPYVKNYEQLLIDLNVDYDIINWDRLNIEESKDQTYRDQKIGHQRNFYDYLKYKQFLMHKLFNSDYDKIIVFGIQLSFFLKNILIKKYKKKFVIDIRDYNKIIKFFDIKKLIKYSQFIVVSSPSYKEWLPEDDNYIINHNTLVKNMDELKEMRVPNINKIRIANIGAIRDLQINKDLIESLKDNDKFELYFHGESDINNKIQSLIDSNKINNIFITGRYFKDDEEQFYENCDLINVLRYNDGINNKTALPNRIYNAILYGKPMVAFEGTFLADQVTKYNLGIVLSSFSNVDQNIINYITEFNIKKFNDGRKHFFSEVIEDNEFFKDSVIKFFKSKSFENKS